MEFEASISALGECAEILTGKNIDKKKTNDEGRGLPYIVGASDIVDGAFSKAKRWVEGEIQPARIARKGDILISCVGTLGKIGVNLQERAVLSGHVLAIRPKSGISPIYLMSIAARLVLDAIPVSQNDDVVLGFQQKLDLDKLRSLRFVCPSLILQEYIVARLASVASFFMAYKCSAGDLLSFDNLIALIETERKEQRAHYKKIAEGLQTLAENLRRLPEDEELKQMISEAEAAQFRLTNI